MKYLVSEQGPIKVAGLTYPPGAPFEATKDLADHFGDQLIPIQDPDLIRTLEVRADPMRVVTAFRWGRVDYAPGDIYWAVNRSVLRQMPPGVVVPATGAEVLAWARRKDAGAATAPTPGVAGDGPPVGQASAPVTMGSATGAARERAPRVQKAASAQKAAAG